METRQDNFDTKLALPLNGHRHFLAGTASRTLNGRQNIECNTSYLVGTLNDFVTTLNETENTLLEY
jgi:hypothetical protein